MNTRGQVLILLSILCLGGLLLGGFLIYKNTSRDKEQYCSGI